MTGARKPSAMRRRLCAAMLALQAVVLGLTTPVLIGVAGVPAGRGLGIGLGLAVACLLVAGLLRFRWAYVLGWGIQVASLALGFLVTVMVALGLIFGALWATAYVLGGRIDRERDAAWATYDAERSTEQSAG